MTRWITERIGTAPHGSVEAERDLAVLDVRDLVDKGGNPVGAIRARVEEGVALLRNGKRVVVCCDYGMSRSSALAAGIIAMEEGIPFDTAVERVVETTGETAIRVEVLGSVRNALGEAGPAPKSARSILVTGGSGYLGKLLVPRLAAYGDVCAPSRADADLTRDVVALDRLARACSADTVVHLANPHVYTTSASLGETLTAVKNVADVCVEQGIQLIYPSGWEVFSGYAAEALLADEDVVPRPGSNYGYAKCLAERLLADVVCRSGLRLSLLRLGAVYGETSPRPKLIWNFLEKAQRGSPIITHRYRNGVPALDLLYADDAIDALEAAVAARPLATLHLGTSVLTSTREVASKLVALVGSTSRVSSHDIGDTVGNVALDSRRAEALLGWKPRVSVDIGLERIVSMHSRKETYR